MNYVASKVNPHQLDMPCLDTKTILFAETITFTNVTNEYERKSILTRADRLPSTTILWKTFYVENIARNVKTNNFLLLSLATNLKGAKIRRGRKKKKRRKEEEKKEEKKKKRKRKLQNYY